MYYLNDFAGVFADAHNVLFIYTANTAVLIQLHINYRAQLFFFFVKYFEHILYTGSTETFGPHFGVQVTEEDS